MDDQVVEQTDDRTNSNDGASDAQVEVVGIDEPTSAPSGTSGKTVAEIADVPDAESADVPEILSGGDEASRLSGLLADARDQDDLEKDISRQADQMLLEQADERDQKRLKKTLAQKEKLISQVRRLQQRLGQAGATVSLKLRAEIDHMQPQIDSLNKDLEQIQARMQERHNDAENDATQADQPGNCLLYTSPSPRD